MNQSIFGPLVLVCHLQQLLLKKKDDNGNKVYTNCSDYGDKTKDIGNLEQGDFVKVFGLYLRLQYLLL